MSFFFVLSLLTWGLLLNPLQLASAQIMYGQQIYWMGPYYFLGCKPDQGDTLMRLFGETGNIISNNIIPEVKNSSYADTNQDPYTIFFSSNNRPDIAKTFQRMIDAPTEPSRPVFVCVNPLDDGGDWLLEGAVEDCKTPYAHAFSSELGGGMAVFLCPQFFDVQKTPDYPTVANCPVVNPNNPRYWGHTGKADINKFAIVIHELAHTYSPHPIAGAEEIYNPNQIMYSKPFFQLDNANNYAFFAVCVYLKCKNYPSVDRNLVTKRSLRQSGDSGGLPVGSDHTLARRQLDGSLPADHSTEHSIIVNAFDGVDTEPDYNEIIAQLEAQVGDVY